MASVTCAAAAAATTAALCRPSSSWPSRAAGGAAASSSRSVAFRGVSMPVRSLRVRVRRENGVDVLQRRIQGGLSVQASAAAEAVDQEVSTAAAPDSQKDLFVGSVGGVKGPVRIRLVRFGRKKLPFYRIFVAHSRARRDGRHIELVGFYNPIAGPDGKKQIGIKADRVKYWLSVGAQPTDTVRGLLYKAGIMQPPIPA